MCFFLFMLVDPTILHHNKKHHQITITLIIQDSVMTLPIAEAAKRYKYHLQEYARKKKLTTEHGWKFLFPKKQLTSCTSPLTEKNTEEHLRYKCLHSFVEYIAPAENETKTQQKYRWQKMRSKFSNYERNNNQLLLSEESFQTMKEQEKQTIETMLIAEMEMSSMKYVECCNCNEVLLCSNKKKNNNNTCERCILQPSKFHHTNNCTPYWLSDDNIKQFHVPPELEDLTLAEQALIAIARPIMNVVHIKNGVLGSRGHVVSIEQKVLDIVRILPRIPEEVRILHVKGRINKKTGKEVNLTVRRHKVTKALKWLLKYNVLYQEMKIEIDESKLDWMAGKEEEELTTTICKNIELTSTIKKQNRVGAHSQVLTSSTSECGSSSTEDLGPAPSQVPSCNEDDEETSGK